MLVQVGTRARPTGWVEREATFKGDDGKQTFHGKQVVSTGSHAVGRRRDPNQAGDQEPGTADGDPARLKRQCPRFARSLRLRAACRSSSCRAMPCTSCSRQMDLETRPRIERSEVMHEHPRAGRRG